MMMAVTTLVLSPMFSAPTSASSSRFRSTSNASASSYRAAFSSDLQITEGLGKLPKVVLRTDNKSEAEVYLFGGCITSWTVSGRKDILYVRPDAVFNGQKPISGGIPHCFPQFGPGSMQQHGFARNMNWDVVGFETNEGDPALTLELKDNPYSRSMWNFSFEALYKVMLGSDSLSTKLVVTNKDSKPFSFSSALHSYFRASSPAATVKGLKGCKTLNKDPDPLNPAEGKEERELVNFPGFVDCIYIDAPNKLELVNGLGDSISIANQNWSDAVLWNPHLQMEACYHDFVCVENAKILDVHLNPDESWTAEQHLSIL